MFSRILVPLDGTPLAEKALPYAIRLANQCGASLVIKRVVQVSSLLNGEVITGEGLEQAQLEVIHNAETYLAEIKKIISDPARKLRIAEQRVQTIAAYGKPVELISELLTLEKIDLIVMTTHGRSGLGELLVGSTAVGVVHRSSVPVMLIRPDRRHVPGETTLTLMDLLDQPANLTLEHPAGQRRILVALDGDQYAEKSLAVATELAAAFQADLHLLEVIAPPLPAGYALGYAGYIEEANRATTQELNEAAFQYLTTIQDRLAPQGLRTIKIVRTGDPSTEIADYAEKAQVLCVVMATHGPGRVEQAFIGSTSQDVLRRIHLPVIMVHPAANETARTEASATKTTTGDQPQA